MRHVSRTHRVALDWLFVRINLDPKIQIKYIDTKNQLADILTKGNLTRDEWSHLLCLFSISHFSSTNCIETVSKRTQEDTGEEREIEADDEFGLVIQRKGSELASTASESPRKTKSENQVPLSSWNEQQPRTRRLVSTIDSLQLRDLDCLLHDLHLRNLHDLDDWCVHQGRRGRKCSWNVVLIHGIGCRVCLVFHGRYWSVVLNHGNRCRMYNRVELHHFHNLRKGHMANGSNFHLVARGDIFAIQLASRVLTAHSRIHVKEIQLKNCLLSGHAETSIRTNKSLLRTVAQETVEAASLSSSLNTCSNPSPCIGDISCKSSSAEITPPCS